MNFSCRIAAIGGLSAAIAGFAPAAVGPKARRISPRAGVSAGTSAPASDRIRRENSS